MAPIRRGDGTGIESVRLGDGTEIAEVRKGDGTVLWTSTPPVIDSFEDGDIAEYSGATGSFAVEDWSGLSQGAADGDMVLSASSDSSDYQTITTTTRDNLPVAGDSFQIWFYTADTDWDEMFASFATQTAPSSGMPDGYTVEFNPYEDRIGFYIDDTAEATSTLSTGTGWHYANVTWDDTGNGDIVVVFYDDTDTEIDRFHIVDTTYFSGGIGWRRYARSGAGFDYAHHIDAVETPPLVASFTTSPQSPGTGDTVTFDATGSEGAISTWDWDFGDGNTGSGETDTHSYSSETDYTVELTVTDLYGATDTTTDTVTVADKVVIDDFEGYTSDSDLQNTYSSPGGGPNLETANPIEGSQSLTNTETYTINARDDFQCSIGNTYSMVVQGNSSGNHPGLVCFVQNVTDSTGTQQDDSYVFHLDIGDDQLECRIWSGGSLDQTVVSTSSLDGSTEYRIEVDAQDTSTFPVRVYEHATDTEIGSGNADVSSAGFTSGGVGWHTGRDSGAYADMIVEEPL